MKVNWAERLLVNNPVRVRIQGFLIYWMKGVLSPGRGARLLEVGCGRGAGARLVAREFQPEALCAMDLDFRMIRQAKAYLSPEERQEIFLSVADATRLPYRDGAFDAVFGFGVLHHVPLWQAALAEIARVIKPGGIYYLEEFYPPLYLNFLARHLFLHPHENRFSSRDLRQALGESGFRLRETLEQKKLGILAVAIREK